MDTVSRDELQELRARAYGPGADIEQDAAALRRLHELETQSRAATDAAAGATAAEPPSPAPIVVRAEAPIEAPVPAPGVPTTPAAAKSSPEEPEPATTAAADLVPPKKRRLSRGIKVLWALSVAASAAAAAAITFGLTYIAPVNVSSGAEQIATLQPVPAIPIPPGWMGAGPSSRVWQFNGLTLFETSGGFYGPTGTDCIAAAATETIPEADSTPDSWTYNGMMYSACRVGDFPTSLELPVDSSSPDDIRAQFPEDSALQFVLEGDRIGVFLDTP